MIDLRQRPSDSDGGIPSPHRGSGGLRRTFRMWRRLTNCDTDIHTRDHNRHAHRATDSRRICRVTHRRSALRDNRFHRDGIPSRPDVRIDPRTNERRRERVRGTGSTGLQGNLPRRVPSR